MHRSNYNRGLKITLALRNIHKLIVPVYVQVQTDYGC